MTEETKYDAHTAANAEQVKQAMAHMKAKAAVETNAAPAAVGGAMAPEPKRYHELDTKVRGHVDRIRDQTAKLQDTVRSAGQPGLADSLGSFRREVEARLGVAPEPVGGGVA